MLTSIAMLQVLLTFKAYRFCFRRVNLFCVSVCVLAVTTLRHALYTLSAASTAQPVSGMQCISWPLAGSSLTGVLGYAVFQHVITSYSVCGGRKRLTAQLLAMVVI